MIPDSDQEHSPPKLSPCKTSLQDLGEKHDLIHSSHQTSIMDKQQIPQSRHIAESTYAVIGMTRGHPESVYTANHL